MTLEMEPLEMGMEKLAVSTLGGYDAGGGGMKCYLHG